ncbi:nicotinate-nucleotide--dimethylbenzimidazole phosphoribosyltransferase [Pseudonocardia sp.]|uniref:nicotinate-nucleotide--dimethylbenzimidazole phosphoribosyltransferase n=1 Tax=Pseudonocardia sp. TaxID=60912 RepID=UPI003442B5DD
MDLPPISPPDGDARRAAVARHAELAVPLGGLGHLAELGCWLAAAQGSCPPRPPGRPRLVIVAADHGIAAAGVSRYPASVTLAQVEAVRTHTAPVAVLAPIAGASIRIVDVGLDHESDDKHHVRRACGRIDREDALTDDEVERAVAAGRAVADEEVDGGADLLIPASLGVGATTAASTLVSALTGAEPVAVIGRGSGVDDHGWMRKAAAVRDALRRARPHARDPLALLRVAGGTDLAALTGFLAQAAVRRTPVLIDGLVVGAAAMLAHQLAPGARAWWLVAQRSPEPAMTLATEQLDLTPQLDLEVRAGDGTGAVAVLPLLQMAARLLAETATAADSGIIPANPMPADQIPAEETPASEIPTGMVPTGTAPTEGAQTEAVQTEAAQTEAAPEGPAPADHDPATAGPGADGPAADGSASNAAGTNAAGTNAAAPTEPVPADPAAAAPEPTRSTVAGGTRPDGSATT